MTLLRVSRSTFMRDLACLRSVKHLAKKKKKQEKKKKKKEGFGGCSVFIVCFFIVLFVMTKCYSLWRAFVFDWRILLYSFHYFLLK